jgi:spermidine synthase
VVLQFLEENMTPWMLLDIAQAPGNGEELRLYKRGAEFSIRVGKCELMNSRVHGSEDALAKLACGRIADCPKHRVLIGGLGMGYTVAAALHGIGVEGQVVVAELVPAVVAWNRGPLAELAGYPLQDERVTVREVDVARIIQTERHAYDAILLDVDNGPEGLTRKDNDWLYSLHGLTMALATLRPGGVLAVWSATSNQAFTHRLLKVGFKVDEVRVRARGTAGGARHTIWIAGRVV